MFYLCAAASQDFLYLDILLWSLLSCATQGLSLYYVARLLSMRHNVIMGVPFVFQQQERERERARNDTKCNVKRENLSRMHGATTMM
jgi:hypothetical protein